MSQSINNKTLDFHNWPLMWSFILAHLLIVDIFFNFGHTYLLSPFYQKSSSHCFECNYKTKKQNYILKSTHISTWLCIVIGNLSCELVENGAVIDVHVHKIGLVEDSMFTIHFQSIELNVHFTFVNQLYLIWPNLKQNWQKFTHSPNFIMVIWGWFLVMQYGED